LNKEKRIYELFSVLMHEGGAGKANIFWQKNFAKSKQNTNKDSKYFIYLFICCRFWALFLLRTQGRQQMVQDE